MFSRNVPGIHVTDLGDASNYFFTRARVMRANQEVVDVEACTASTCENCPGGCNWGGWRGPRRLTVDAPEDFSLEAGDRVWVAVRRNAVLRAAWWTYGAPLSGLLLGALLGSRFGSETLSALMAMIGAGLGLVLARYLVGGNWLAPQISLLTHPPR